MIVATLCYVRDSGRTLMLHRIKKQNDMHNGKWNGLGGKLEPGESPEECVVREVEEESGLAIKNPRFAGTLTFPDFYKGDWIVFVYTADEFEGELIDSDEGVLKWIDDDKLLDLNLWESDYMFIPWVMEGKQFSAKFAYSNGKLERHNVWFN